MMSLHNAVMSAMKRHMARPAARKMPPLNRETAGKTPGAEKLTNETGEAGDEGMSTYAKKHRDLIKSKSKNQSAGRKAHPGFKAVQGKIQAEGYSQKVAGAILAARSRHASAAAHKANPHLNRVKG
jgi:methionine salvage enolase-phosphatase E1